MAEARRAVPCVLMRGGTSRGIVVRDEELSRAPEERAREALALFGSPELLELDGIGGGSPQTSKLAVVGQQHPAATGGQQLVAVEGEHAHRAEGTRRPAGPRGSDRFGRVLHEDRAVVVADRFDAGVVRALAVQVHRDHGLHRASGPATIAELVGQEIRIEAPR